MPTSSVPFAASNAWLAALATAQTDAPASAPSASAPASAPPVIPGMPADAASTTGAQPAAGTTGQPLGPGGTGARPAAGGNDFVMFLFWGLMILMVVVLFSSGRAQRREKKKRDELIASVRRGDKVQTIGGVIGTVVELRDDEIVLQGENPGSKFRFSRPSIQQVIKASGSPAESAPEVEVKAGKEGSKV